MARKLPMKEKRSKVFVTPIEVIKDEMTEVNGRLIKSSKVVTFDPVVEMSVYNANDFCLENILSVGAIDLLKPTKLSQDRMTAMDNAEYQMSYQEMVLDMENNNVKNTDE